MKIFKITLFLVVLFLIVGGSYIYNKVSPPPLPDTSHAVADLSDGSVGRVLVKSKSPYNMSVLLKDLQGAPDVDLPVVITLPQGASAEHPVPAMVIIHGSGGLSLGREYVYAAILAQHGIASLVMDYYAARGVTPDMDYMMKVMSTTEVDLIVDAYASLKVLATHPAIDSKRIGVMGFSYGGMAARYVANRQMRDLLAPDVPPFAAHIDFYGPCHQTLMSAETTGAPYLSLRGALDSSNDLEACARVEADMAKSAPVETHVYKTAGHAWEIMKEHRLYEKAPYVKGCSFSFSEEGAPTVNGVAKPFYEPDLDASRTTRALKRMSVQAFNSSCVRYGYIMGLDVGVRDDAYVRMLSFLQETFKM